MKGNNMSEENKFGVDDSLLTQVTNELKKTERDAAKAKLKVIMQKRLEAEKTIRLLDLEAEKVVKDFNNGVLL
jgi:hypothetical protein